MSTADLVRKRVCLDQGGAHVLEVEAESENLAAGYLTLDDGSKEGKYVASAMRLAGQARSVRSKEVVLHAGEPCYLVTVQTGIDGDRTTARLIRIDDEESVQPESAAVMDQPNVAPMPSGVVCDRFDLQWELDGGELLLAVDTDLPDEGELSVTVYRSYYEVGSSDEYRRDYMHVIEPVSRWRDPRRIPLDAKAWRADLAKYQKKLAEIDAAGFDGLAFEVARISDHVDIRAVLHLRQDDSRFGGQGNPKLSGAATSTQESGVLVEAEASFKLPLE